MGVLPLQFKEGTTRQTLGLKGDEIIDVVGVEAGLRPRMELTLRLHDAGGGVREEKVICRIDTLDEVEYFRHGGILQYVLRSLLPKAA
jgi:aconitate hydratase